ncbi:MAG: UDP-N-acetylmuramoyl-tripeptide--D-alanyl-D-alanine ligase [Aurantibacter sp.]
MTISQLHQHFLEHPKACTDTRKVIENCLFFALKGANFNGNHYAAEALNKGASFAIVDEEEYVEGDRTILVENVLQTLQKLATYHRKYSKAKVIAITGSNGKTTTKELIYAVLSKKYSTVATIGNLNNHIGVPLTLLSIKPETEIAIVEMGANHLKEIEFLCSLAQPDFGYITNFGKAHLEGFGSEEGVIKGKSELYSYLMENGRPIFMNADDPVQLQKLSTYVKKYGFSKDKNQFYKIELLSADPFIRFNVENETIESQLMGSYNFPNCCAAFLMGKYFNVPKEEIKTAIESYIPQNNRSQLMEKSGHRVILDAYNANPTSMVAALENLKAMNTEHKIVILGDMFELGTTAAKEHQQIAESVSRMHFDKVFLVGENFNETESAGLKCTSFEELAKHLEQIELPASTILIKGSRGMALERVLDFI